MTDDTTQQKSSTHEVSHDDVINRIVNVIEQASHKAVNRNKIINFLKKQPDITENNINIAYTRYYEKHVCICILQIRYYTYFELQIR